MQNRNLLFFILLLAILPAQSAPNEKFYKILAALDFYAKNPLEISLQNIKASFEEMVGKLECHPNSDYCEAQGSNTSEMIRLVSVTIPNPQLKKSKVGRVIFEINEAHPCIKIEQMSNWLHLRAQPLESLPSAPLHFDEKADELSYANFIFIHKKNEQTRITTQSVNGCVRILTLESHMNSNKE